MTPRLASPGKERRRLYLASLPPDDHVDSRNSVRQEVRVASGCRVATIEVVVNQLLSESRWSSGPSKARTVLSKEGLTRCEVRREGRKRDIGPRRHHRTVCKRLTRTTMQREEVVPLNCKSVAAPLAFPSRNPKQVVAVDSRLLR